MGYPEAKLGQMEYQEGTIGRVFVIRFDHGDDLLDALSAFVKEKVIKTGWLFILGGLESAELVTGPESPVIPPNPLWDRFSDGREILALGSIFWEGNMPKIHLHGVAGRAGETLMGCLRERMQVYLFIEAMILELKGIDAIKRFDNSKGVSVLAFK
ncbi:MAG TPA: DNA-binding protein [Syntrophaceae bacterium]|nr:DNA-binding protein [Syntrophaceae bacterium]